MDRRHFEPPEPTNSILSSVQWLGEFEFPQGRVWANYFGHQQWLFRSPSFRSADRMGQRHLKRVFAEIIEEENENDVSYHLQIYRQLTGTQAYANANRLESLALRRYYIERRPDWPTEELVGAQLRRIRSSHSGSGLVWSLSSSSATTSSDTSESSSEKYTSDESTEENREEHTSDESTEEDKAKFNTGENNQRIDMDTETRITAVPVEPSRPGRLFVRDIPSNPEQAPSADTTATKDGVPSPQELPSSEAFELEVATPRSNQTQTVLVDDEEDLIIQRKEIELLRAELALMKRERGLKRKHDGE